jgi:hypothetical protein
MRYPFPYLQGMSERHFMSPNHALQQTRPSRTGCNPCVPYLGSLNFGRQTPSHIMKIRHPLIIVSMALFALLMAGCATERQAQTQSIREDSALLSATNSLPGSTYDLRVYVIAKGDSVARIAHKFGISIADLKAINPGLNSTRLKVGQKIRISEKLTK